MARQAGRNRTAGTHVASRRLSEARAVLQKGDYQLLSLIGRYPRTPRGHPDSPRGVGRPPSLFLDHECIGNRKQKYATGGIWKL